MKNRHPVETNKDRMAAVFSFFEIGHAEPKFVSIACDGARGRRC